MKKNKQLNAGNINNTQIQHHSFYYLFPFSFFFFSFFLLGGGGGLFSGGFLPCFMSFVFIYLFLQFFFIVFFFLLVLLSLLKSSFLQVLTSLRQKNSEVECLVHREDLFSLKMSIFFNTFNGFFLLKMINLPSIVSFVTK